MKTIDWSIQLLNELKELDFVADIKLIQPPTDVEADLSILLITNHWNGEYTNIISEIITNTAEKMLQETGHSIGVYWDCQTAA